WWVVVPDAVRLAALFPDRDMPRLPAGHPSRHAFVAGGAVALPAGLPCGRGGPGRQPGGPRVGGVTGGRVCRSPGERPVAGWRGGEGGTKGLWLVAEAASPGDLAERLRGLGMRTNDFPGAEAREAAMVAVEPPTPGPRDVVARKAATFDEFLAAQLVAVDAFAMDETMRRSFEERAERLWPFQSEDGVSASFVAFLDGEVVASATAVFGHTAVYLGGSGTLPDRRGRGAYRALVRARWDAAVERGTPALTVGAGEMSRPILERLGFQIVGWSDCLLAHLLPTRPGIGSAHALLEE